MRAPDFWRSSGPAARLLAPLSALYAGATARRLARPGWAAPVPVICCGGVTAGGAGKTPVALDIGRRLIARGASPAFLTRGHGGTRTALPVRAGQDDAAEVGDEPLLLAAVAPTFVAADRALAARAAIASGANVLVMDDGLQNPGLAKTLSLLVVDGASGFGNGRVIPAGPLREPVEVAARRCAAAIVMGPDRADLARLPAWLPRLRARVVARDPARWRGLRAVAFAGIARPEKFFATLRDLGADPVLTRGFADHHRFQPRELDWLARQADRLGAALVTTEKDFSRLPAGMRARTEVLRITLAWHDPREIDDLLAGLC